MRVLCSLAVLTAVLPLIGWAWLDPTPEGGTPCPMPVEQRLAEDEGPADGLTLDAALERLVVSNYGLRARFQDVPESRADELTASLRNAPAIFLNGNQLPYGRYSGQRPGAAAYEVSPALNVDYSGKRKSHMRQARLATRQVEARYQNAVRGEIERLYEAYVDVLEARGTVLVAQANLGWLTELASLGRGQVQRGQRPKAEIAGVSLRRFNAETTLGEAEGQLLQARRNLAALLAVPLERADGLTIRGALRDRSPPPSGAEEMLRIAVESRPDLAAGRLGIAYNRASVEVVQAETFDDAIVFYSPFQAQDNTPQGKRVSTSWGGGAGTSLPLLDRNQGDIARSRINVTQTRIELDGLERRVANEVQRAWTEYEASREALGRFEQEGIPLLRRLRDEKLRRHSAGEAEVSDILEAQKDYSEELQHYVRALARHRRAVLRLNTVVGQRIVPGCANGFWQLGRQPVSSPVIAVRQTA